MLEKALETLKTLKYGDDIASLTELDDAIAKAHGNEAATQEIETGLLSILNGESTHNAKDYACRKLKLVASEASVATLEKMLHDEKLSHMARFALQAMPAAGASKALLNALPKLSGTLKAGVIGSLGVRQDNGAVSTLASLLTNSDATVAKAAASALGAIGSKDAAKALSNAKPHNDAIATAIDSSLACAEKLLAGGDKTGALMIYNQLSKGDQPKHIQLAARRGKLACARKKSA